MFLASGIATTVAGELCDQDILLAGLRYIFCCIWLRNLAKKRMVNIKHGLSFVWREERISMLCDELCTYACVN